MDLVDQAELAEASGPREPLIPLTRTSWLTLFDEATVAGLSTETLAREGRLLPALALVSRGRLPPGSALNRRLAVVDETRILERERTASRRTAEQAARQRLFNIYDLPVDREAAVEDTALADALGIVGRHQGIDFRVPARARGLPIPRSVSWTFSMRPGCARGACGSALRETPGAYGGAATATHCWRSAPEDGQPVALLPGALGRYREVDPGQQAQRPRDAGPGRGAGGRSLDVLPALAGQGRAAGGPAGDGHARIWRGRGAPGARGDSRRPGQAAPRACAGIRRESPGGGAEAWGALYAVAVTLAGFGLLGALLHLFQNTAMMRLEGRSASRVEAAFWDRLMRLPTQRSAPPAGRRSGPCRGMTFQNLRDGLQGVVADSLLSMVFLLPVFGVVFFYDTTLGIVALAFSLVALSVTVALGLRQIAPQGRMIGAVRRVAGHLFQVVGGIAKLRVENAEGSAFAIWAPRLSRAETRGTRTGGARGTCAGVRGRTPLPRGRGAALRGGAANADERNVPVGDFLVVYTVFVVFQSAIARLGESFGTVAAMVPAFDQMRPLLAAVPEAEVEGEPVERLGGDVLFDHVSFRYDPEGPPDSRRCHDSGPSRRVHRRCRGVRRRQEHPVPARAGDRPPVRRGRVLRRTRPETPEPEAGAAENRHGSAVGAAPSAGHLGQHRGPPRGNDHGGSVGDGPRRRHGARDQGHAPWG